MRQILCKSTIFSILSSLFSLQELQHKWVEPERQHSHQRQQDSGAML